VNLDAYRIVSEPYYQPVDDEIAVFEAAFAERLPVMLKGPTGCGKTRFVEHMAWRLAKPLITVAAHEDMTASDLAGRYLNAVVVLDVPKIKDCERGQKSDENSHFIPPSLSV
jgi:nitric oxide reductase NorQ protein